MSWSCIILCIALIVFFLVCRCLSPLSRRCSNDVTDDTNEELYYLQKCQASKTPLFIPIQSHSLALALFYCIRTTTIQLLHVALVEPLSSAWPVSTIICHIIHLLVHCIELNVVSVPLSVLFPFGRRCSDDVIDDTDEEIYYLRKCQARKTPLFITIQSYSLAPSLFYCIRTTTIHLLLAAVAEPLYPLHDLSLPQ